MKGSEVLAGTRRGKSEFGGVLAKVRRKVPGQNGIEEGVERGHPEAIAEEFYRSEEHFKTHLKKFAARDDFEETMQEILAWFNDGEFSPYFFTGTVRDASREEDGEDRGEMDGV